MSTGSSRLEARESSSSGDPCPLCGGLGSFHARAKDIEYFTSDEYFTIRHCAACDILYVDPMLFDQLHVIYPSNYYSFTTPKRTIVSRIKEWLDARSLKSLLREIPGEKLKVLDIGGGSGWLASLVARIDPRVTVTQIVDFDEGARELAEAAGHQYFCGPIEDFETEERYDLILMLNLIEHVKNPRSVLEKSKQLLSSNGRIYIKTPNFRSLDERVFRHADWGGYHCPRHFILFTRESLTRVLRSVGLRVIGFNYTQGAPFWSISILGWLHRRGLIHGSSDRPLTFHPLMPVLQAGSAAFDFLRQPFSPLSQMIVVAAGEGPHKQSAND